MPIRPRSATIDAANEFTAVITVKDGADVFFEDTNFIGKITVQSRSCASSTWVDEETIICEGNDWHRRYEGKKVDFRAGCKTGDFTSGSCIVRVQG